MSLEQPYLPPQPPEFAYLPPSIAAEPPVVKVFGVLHLVFAGFGLIFGAWGLLIVFVGNPILKFMPKTDSMNVQLEMQAKIIPLTLTQSILTLLVAVPMIIAGIYLLKNRKKGLKWSNFYAYSSLAAKLVNMVLVIVIMIPAMNEMHQKLQPKSPSAGSFEQIIQAATAFGALLGVLVTCIYPILSLVLLNRPRVKEWLERHEK